MGSLPVSSEKERAKRTGWRVVDFVNRGTMGRGLLSRHRSRGRILRQPRLTFASFSRRASESIRRWAGPSSWASCFSFWQRHRAWNISSLAATMAINFAWELRSCWERFQASMSSALWSAANVCECARAVVQPVVDRGNAHLCLGICPLLVPDLSTRRGVFVQGDGTGGGWFRVHPPVALLQVVCLAHPAGNTLGTTPLSVESG